MNFKVGDSVKIKRQYLDVQEGETAIVMNLNDCLATIVMDLDEYVVGIPADRLERING